METGFGVSMGSNPSVVPDYGLTGTDYAGVWSFWNAHMSPWPAKACKLFCNAGEFPTNITSLSADKKARWQAAVDQGCRIYMCYQPDPALSSSDQTDIVSSLNGLTSVGMKIAGVILHQEVNNTSHGITSTQYRNLVNYYGPSITGAGYKLGHCSGGGTSSTWSDYFHRSPGGGLPAITATVSFHACDFYSQTYTGGVRLDPGSGNDINVIAASYTPELAVGVTEMGNNSTGGTATQTNVTNYVHYLRDFILARQSGGHPTMDSLWFNGQGGEQNVITSPTDYRWALLQDFASKTTISFVETQVSANIAGASGAVGLWFSQVGGVASTAGSLLVARLMGNDGGATVTAPSGWELESDVKAGAGTNTARVQIWAYRNNPGGLYGTSGSPANFSFTSGTWKGRIAEFSSGAGTSQYVDKVTTGVSGTSAVTSIPMTMASNQYAGDLAVGIFAAWFSTAPTGQTWGTPSGWNSDGNINNVQAVYNMIYDTGLPIGSSSLTQTISTSTNMTSWVGAMVTFTSILSIPTGSTVIVTLTTAQATVGGNPLTSSRQTVALTTAQATALPIPLQVGTSNVLPGSVPIVITVELLINDVWTDISSYVYQRDGFHITGGRQDESSQSEPATLTFTVDNSDGRFSPGYTGGDYYPYLTRDVRVRASVTYGFYTGYRFHGEITTWPPLSDPSGTDVYVQVIANGPLRKIRQSGGKASVLARYLGSLTGIHAPVAYWPCEEDTTSGLCGCGIFGDNMQILSGTPVWKAISDFNGSAPIGVLNNSVWDGQTNSFGFSGDDIYIEPGTYYWQCPPGTTAPKVRCWGSSGGGANGSQGAAGGGGEIAEEPTLAVTPGNYYSLTVPEGGAGGKGAPNVHNGGVNGSAATFVGDAVTVTANGGKGGGLGTGGAGGTGSTNTTHRNGGAGGTNPSNFKGGAGGGSSAGISAAGNAGSNSSGSTGASGGTAPSGGGKGGRGGNGGANPQQGSPGISPGGGGGGGGDSDTGWNWAGGAGAPGKVEIIYTPVSVPNANVIRFILLVPKHGGNSNKVLIRAFSSGTVAQLDVMYVSGGKLQLTGYKSGGAQIFTSGVQNWHIDGQTVMVSAELANSGANVTWKLQAIVPGASSVIGTATGTYNSASVGNVSEILAGPNADITKTAIGHISVQYAAAPLTRVSKVIHGHTQEMGIDRFIRLAKEQAIDNVITFNEKKDHWGFEDGSVQDCRVTNATLSNDTFALVGTYFGDEDFVSPYDAGAWPTQGSRSLKITANGVGQPEVYSATATSGLVVINPGDRIAIDAEVYTPTTLVGDIQIFVQWFDSTGNALGLDFGEDATFYDATAGTVQKIRYVGECPQVSSGIVPQYCNWHIKSNATESNGTFFYIDNVRTHPRMGAQTRKEMHHIIQEIEHLDRGLLHEARELHGLKYRTRISLFFQTASLTLDYSNGHIIPPLEPVVDDQNYHDHVTVLRQTGSRVTAVGHVALQFPIPAGKKKRKIWRVVAAEDEQLLALAQHLLNLGTVTDERYPTVSVNVVRSEVASMVNAIATVEIGDFIKIIGLPFWYPNTTAKQIVLGYTEDITPFDWTITWNCAPESPYEIDIQSFRRW